MSTLLLILVIVYVALSLAAIFFWRREYRKEKDRYYCMFELYRDVTRDYYSGMWNYYISRTSTAVEVIGQATTSSGAMISIVVKRFPFNAEDMDSVNFAKLLAEELLEKLLEK